MTSYYDIDAILSEEELVPCTTLFDFAHLAHLDPDYSHFHHTQKRRIQDGDDQSSRKSSSSALVLPEGHRIKMPLWSVEKWATLGFVRIGLPRHYGRKARERLVADPALADLRVRSERFFMAGLKLVDLIERCSKVTTTAINNSRNGNRSRRSAHAAAMAEVQKEAVDLRQILVVTYTGERLRRTLDWTLNSIEDDVSGYTCRLTEIEKQLFCLGAAAARAYHEWKNFGSRRIAVSKAIMTTKMMTPEVLVPPNTRNDMNRPQKRLRVVSGA